MTQTVCPCPIHVALKHVIQSTMVPVPCVNVDRVMLFLRVSLSSLRTIGVAMKQCSGWGRLHRAAACL